MIRTRVGYAGGTRENPTYHHLGDHAETIEVDYDPAVIRYEDLLDIFWRSHSPDSRPWSRQYMSAIFYHDEEQKRLAAATRDREAARRGSRIYTEILPFERFYRAEDYHQKYYLRAKSELAKTLRGLFPDEKAFSDSFVAARLNAYFGGDAPLSKAAEAVRKGEFTESEKGHLINLLEKLRR